MKKKPKKKYYLILTLIIILVVIALLFRGLWPEFSAGFIVKNSSISFIAQKGEYHAQSCGEKDSLCITFPKPNTIIQRNSTTGNIPISGCFNGELASIEARFNGGEWQTIENATAHCFRSALLHQPTGQGNLEIRMNGNMQEIPNVGIGDVFVVAGQSNAEGKGDNLHQQKARKFSASVYRQDDLWLPNDDPTTVDDPYNEIQKTRRIHGQEFGSIYPILGDLIMEQEEVPVAFITTAVSGTSITDWDNWHDVYLQDPAYTDMFRQVHEATGGTMRVKAVLFLQGETDVQQKLTPSLYNKSLLSLGRHIEQDIGVPLLVGQIGSYYDEESDVAMRLDTIRYIQQQSWGQRNILPGPVTYDIGPLQDHAHFSTDEQLQTLAQRWWTTIDAAVYGHGSARGPQLLGAHVNGNQVELQFNRPLTGKGEGFLLNNIFGQHPPTTVTVEETKVLLQFARIDPGSLITLGSYTTAQGLDVIKGENDLPAEMFTAQLQTS